MWRNLCEISCGRFPWKLKDENLQKKSPQLRCFFGQSFEIDRPKNSPEFRSGRLRPQRFGWSSERSLLCRPDKQMPRSLGQQVPSMGISVLQHEAAEDKDGQRAQKLIRGFIRGQEWNTNFFLYQANGRGGFGSQTAADPLW